MKRILTLIFALCLICGLTYYGCDVPYSNEFGPGDLDRLLEAQGEDTICLKDGFDTACIKTYHGKDGKDGKDGRDGKDGKDGKDGRDGKDGATLIAIKEVPAKQLVKTIAGKIVVNIEAVEVDKILEELAKVIQNAEVPVEVFVTETIEIIKKIPEIEYVEVPVTEVVEVVKTVYRQGPSQTATDGATYTSSAYTNLPSGWHRHTITHTHDGATHTHRLAHPNGEPDNWDRLHDGYSGLTHD